MGIDIYAVWKGQTEEEKKRQVEAWLSAEAGQVGYLREAYHGKPYATRFLFREAFESETGGARIRAEILQTRLPEALNLVEQRERQLYHETAEHQIDAVK